MNNLMLIVLACIGVFGFFIVLFGFLLLMRYLNYRENVKMAEKGITRQARKRPNRGLLIAGWIITILGLLITLLLWVVFALFMNPGMVFPFGLGPWVILGLIPLLFGLVLLLVYVVKAPSPAEMQETWAAAEVPAEAFSDQSEMTGDTEEPDGLPEQVLPAEEASSETEDQSED